MIKSNRCHVVEFFKGYNISTVSQKKVEFIVKKKWGVGRLKKGRGGGGGGVGAWRGEGGDWRGADNRKT